ncbi:WRC-like protein [Artemisia annua]|uniref:WRC-like protein n=1 Tax=Artemisia annua TaxID=35608 RepID=A0A2U1KEH9_ARTAN|nr:WRC-like protein [Artemisia annua]
MLWSWCIYQLALTYICSSMVSVKTFEGVNNDVNDAKNDCDGVLAFKDTEKSEIREEIVLCGKIDEEGWQCGKVVKNGENVCEDHIIELKKHTVHAAKKEAQPVHGSLVGSGPRHSKKRVLANPYDQEYYYSGFGPNWGKKRGSGSSISNKYNEPAKIVLEENKIKEMSLAEEDKVNLGKGEENMYETEVSEVGPTKLKYDDDDDDYNDKKVKTGITVKKRKGKAIKVRKAMKARSFKSLI